MLTLCADDETKCRLTGDDTHPLTGSVITTTPAPPNVLALNVLASNVLWLSVLKLMTPPRLSGFH